MTLEEIMESFEDYRRESHNDSIDIDKLKEVLPAMIKELVDYEVEKEICRYLDGLHLAI